MPIIKREHLTPIILSSALFIAGAAVLAHPRLSPQRRPDLQAKPLSQSSSGQQIDLVLAIDTSSSMDGLIDGARQQLWETVGQLGRMDPKPTLRVGLISYGNTGYEKGEGWVRVDSDLTSDLDAIYAKLFALRTHGGDEYVARALHVAATRLSWEQGARTRRLFVIAGNEAADQDPEYSLDQALVEAQRGNIQVNTIYCGSAQNYESALWQTVAVRGLGKYAQIDHNAAVAVNTPVDKKLADLSSALNATYVSYGKNGAARSMNQAAQDQNAASLGTAAAAARAVAKSSQLYRNADWDLVDAAKDGKLDRIKDEDLPAELRSLSPVERKAVLLKKSEEREQLQKQINELSTERSGYIRAKKAKMPARKSLDVAMDSLL